MTMLSNFRGKCPICNRATTPPLRIVLLGPLFPFGSWQCSECFSPLRLRLMPYYVLAIFGFFSLLALSAIPHPDHPLLGILALPIALFLIEWVPARYAPVDVDK